MIRKVLLLLILLSPCAVTAQSADSATVGMALSHLTGLTGWAAEESLRVFQGDALYDLVDGGAALYMEYGFVRAYVARFQRNQNRVGVEVFEMAGPEQAYGVFSYLSAGSTNAPALFGQEGRLGEDFIIFWKGNCAVTVTTLEGNAPGELAAFAASLDLELPEAGEKPSLARLLQDRVRVPEVVYFRGPLGYQKKSGLIAPDSLFIQEGVMAEVEGCDAVVLRYQDRALSRRVLRTISEILGAERGGVLDRSESGGLFVSRGRYYALRSSGRHLIQVAGTGKQLVSRVAGRLRAVVGQ